MPRPVHREASDDVPWLRVSRPRRWIVAVVATVVVSVIGGCSVFGDDDADRSIVAQAAPGPATTASTWTALYDDVSDGVGRISVTSCRGASTGSGFLVDTDLMMTAAHVVDQATSVSVRLGTDVRSGRVLGTDRSTDLALIRLDEPAPGHVFEMAAKAPAGIDVATVGYPLGQPVTMTRGRVKGIDRRVEVEGRNRGNLLQSDVRINRGNSGGPVLTIHGDVVGVVSARTGGPGDGYAVQQPLVKDALRRWRHSEPLRTDEACPVDSVVDRGVTVEVTTSTTHPEGPTLAQVFQLYADAINTGRYEIAWGMLTPDEQRRHGSLTGFTGSLTSSYWLSLDVKAVQPLDPTTDVATVVFRTVQDASTGPGGQTCSDWTVRYWLALDSGSWRIDRARTQGAPRGCSARVP